MKAKPLFWLLTTVLLTTTSSVEAQQPAKLPRIAFLGVRPDDSKTTFKSFKQELQKLGCVDGQIGVVSFRPCTESV